MQNLRVQFNIPHSPTTNPVDPSSSIIQSTPQTPTQQNTSNIPSDYLSSTPTSEKIRENPCNPPATTVLLPYWMTHAFPQGEPNLVNDPIDVSSDTSLSLPETLSLLSTPSITQSLHKHHFQIFLQISTPDIEKIQQITYNYY